MRILICTVGTRGDVQPYLALAVGLKAAGHEVMVCTCPRFESFVTNCGILFSPLDEGLLEFLDSFAGRELISSLNSVFDALRILPRVLKRLRPIHHRMVADAWTATEAFAPELLVYHPKMFCVPAFAAKRNIPAVLALLYPSFVPTGEAPFFGLPRWPLGRFYNRATYHLLHLLTTLGTRSYLRRWRSNHDPENDSRCSSLTRTSPSRPIPVMHGYSQFVCPRPPDWPNHAIVCGYWFLPPIAAAPMAGPPPRGLLEFLADKPAPIYVGFGSMVGTRPEHTTEVVLSAIERANVRAVVARGWGGLSPAALPATVQMIDAASHDWLFPQVAAVVHHGGAGTTAAGLRAGCPTIICPSIPR